MWIFIYLPTAKQSQRYERLRIQLTENGSILFSLQSIPYSLSIVNYFALRIHAETLTTEIILIIEVDCSGVKSI